MIKQTKYGTIRRYSKKSNGFYDCSKCGETFDAEYKMWSHEQKHIDDGRINTPSNSKQHSLGTSPILKKPAGNYVSPSLTRQAIGSTPPGKNLTAHTKINSMQFTPTSSRQRLSHITYTPDNDRKTPQRKVIDFEASGYNMPERNSGGSRTSLPMNVMRTPAKGLLSPSLSQIKTPTLLNTGQTRCSPSILSPLLEEVEGHDSGIISPLALPIQETPNKREDINYGEDITSYRISSMRSHGSTYVTPSSMKSNGFNRNTQLNRKMNIVPTQLQFKSPSAKQSNLVTVNQPARHPRDEDSYTVHPINHSSGQRYINYGDTVSNKMLNSNVVETQDIIFRNSPDSSEIEKVSIDNHNRTIQSTGYILASGNDIQKLNTSFDDDTSTLWDEESIPGDELQYDNNDEQKAQKQFPTKQRNVNKMKQGLERIYTCKYCGKSYAWKGILLRHIRKHENVKPYECDQCGKTFRLHDALTRHYRVHTGEKPFQCGQCDRRFRDMSNLRQHQQSHATSKNFICTTCGRAYKNKRLLSMHNCPKNYLTNVEMLKAIASEKEKSQKPHPQQSDVKRLIDRYGIDPSEQYDPTAGNNSPKNKGSVYCRICYHKFKNAKLLEKHLITEHDLSPDTKQSTLSGQGPHFPAGIRPGSNTLDDGHTCPICNKVLGSLHGYKIHLMRMHKRDSDDFLVGDDKSLKKPVFYQTTQSSKQYSKMNSSCTPAKKDNYNDKAINNKHLLGQIPQEKFHSGIRLRSNVSDEGHACPICNKVLGTLHGFKLHIVRMHKHDPDDFLIGVDKPLQKPGFYQTTQGSKQYSEMNSSCTLKKTDNYNEMAINNKHLSRQIPQETFPSGIRPRSNASDEGHTCPICTKVLDTLHGFKLHIVRKHKRDPDEFLIGVDKSLKKSGFYQTTQGSKQYSEMNSSCTPANTDNYKDNDTHKEHRTGDNMNYKTIQNDNQYTEHQGITIFPCTTCGFIGKSFKAYKMHCVNKHGYDPGINPVCGQGNSFSCPLCPKTVKSINGLKLHTIRMHNFDADSLFADRSLKKPSFHQNQTRNYNGNVQEKHPHQSNNHMHNLMNCDYEYGNGEVITRCNNNSFPGTSNKQQRNILTNNNNSMLKQPANKDIVKHSDDESSNSSSDLIGDYSDTGEQENNPQHTNNHTFALKRRNSLAGHMSKEELLQNIISDKGMLETVTSVYNNLVSSQTDACSVDGSQSMQNLPEKKKERRASHHHKTDQRFSTDDYVQLENDHEIYKDENIQGMSFHSNNDHVASECHTGSIQTINAISCDKISKDLTVNKQQWLMNHLKGTASKLLKQYLVEYRGYFQCQCGCLFSDRLLLALHRRMHYFGDILQCSFCEVKFQSLIEFFRHINSHEK